MMTVIFTHVPKCAGSSINASLFGKLTEEEYFIVNDGNVDIKLLSENIRDYKYVGGHIRYHEARALFPEAKLVGAIREPAERLLSLFTYQIRIGLRPKIHSHDPQITFVDWLTMEDANDQCAFFSESISFAEAVHNIANDYTLVWDIARVADAWPIIHGLVFDEPRERSLALRSENVAPKAKTVTDIGNGLKPGDQFLTPRIRSIIYRRNSEDVRLYKWISEHGMISRLDSLPAHQ